MLQSNQELLLDLVVAFAEQQQQMLEQQQQMLEQHYYYYYLALEPSRVANQVVQLQQMPFQSRHSWQLLHVPDAEVVVVVVAAELLPSFVQLEPKCVLVVAAADWLSAMMQAA